MSEKIIMPDAPIFEKAKELQASAKEMYQWRWDEHKRLEEMFRHGPERGYWKARDVHGKRYYCLKVVSPEEKGRLYWNACQKPGCSIDCPALDMYIWKKSIEENEWDQMCRDERDRIAEMLSVEKLKAYCERNKCSPESSLARISSGVSFYEQETLILADGRQINIEAFAEKRLIGEISRDIKFQRARDDPSYKPKSEGWDVCDGREWYDNSNSDPVW